MYKNIIKKNPHIKIFFLSITLVTFVSCVETSTTKPQTKQFVSKAKNSKLDYSNYSNAVSIVTDDKKYLTKLYSNIFPLKVGKVHSWTLEVKTAAGVQIGRAHV